MQNGYVHQTIEKRLVYKYKHHPKQVRVEYTSKSKNEGKEYEKIPGANLRGDKPNYFTPRNVMKMIVEMINSITNEEVLEMKTSYLIQRYTT